LTIVTQSGTESYRLRVGSVLLGYRPSAWKRLRLEYLAGVGFVQEHQGRVSDTTFFIPLPPPATTPAPTHVDVTSTQYDWAVVAGTDLSIELSSRVAIVQQFRVKTFSGLFSVAPGVGIVFAF
jgi:hypothetical protein